jgi:hypothetical protein
VCEREGARHCGCTAGVREVSKCHLRVCNMWEERRRRRIYSYSMWCNVARIHDNVNFITPQKSHLPETRCTPRFRQTGTHPLPGAPPNLSNRIPRSHWMAYVTALARSTCARQSPRLRDRTWLHARRSTRIRLCLWRPCTLLSVDFNVARRVLTPLLRVHLRVHLRVALL